MILQKFNYDTAGLATVINDQSLDLLTRSFFEGVTASTFAKQTGIKSSDDLHYIETELFYQDDDGCGFTASGKTSFPGRKISVGKIKIQQDFCPRDLEGFWTERGLKPGSNYDAMAFQTDWTNYMVQLMGEVQEDALWQSNLSTGTGNFGKYDGFLAIIDAASAVTINGNTSGVTVSDGITPSNVITIFDNMWMSLPRKLKRKSDLMFKAGTDTFDKLILALKNANMFHYNGVDASAYESGEVALPGCGYKVKAFPGLDGTNRILLSRISNYKIGTDLESDEDEFDIRIDPVSKKILLDIHFKAGTQVKFPNEIVQFKLVP
jgi:hypothetical protein